jgi:20S proteasome alpha/beta subunit
VTICAAGINQAAGSPTSIITVCDRKLSWGPISAEGMAWKIQTVHRKWRVMFAGPISHMVPLVDAVKFAAANAPENRLRSFARLCSRAYRAERRNIIETEILGQYDIESYAAYLALKESDRDFFDLLTEEIKKVEEGWSLLFLGFDESDRPHLFVISEFGKIQYCDAEGFAAIGSGAWTAYAALSRSGFNRFIRRGEAMYSILAAKFAAEAAEGVGEETIFLVVKPTDKAAHTVPVLITEHVNTIREKWRKLPRIPDGVVDGLEIDIGQTETIPSSRVQDDPLRGYADRRKRKKPRP